MKIAVIISISFLMVKESSGHQDTRIKFAKGELSGLPQKYSPAYFDLETKTLKIGKKVLVLPGVLKDLFTDEKVVEILGEKTILPGHPFTLTFLASWYHKSSEENAPFLPPYLLIKIAPESRDYAFEILVDLDQVVLIRASVETSLTGRIPIEVKAAEPVREK